MKNIFGKLTDKIISAQYLIILMKLVESFHVSANKVFKKSGLDPNLLNHPESYISALQFKKIVTAALALTKEPALGLYFGQELNISSHGFLGYAAMSSSTLEEAIRFGIKYMKIRTQLVKLDYVVNKDIATVKIEPLLLLGDLHRFVIDTVIVNLFELKKFLLGKKTKTLSINFDFKKPADAAYYKKIFNCPINFESDSNQISFPASELSKSLLLSDPHLAKVAEQHLEKAEAHVKNSIDLESEVKQVLLSTPGFFPQLEYVSEKLCVSPRTLKRKLQQLETSYQIILDEVRYQEALRYLKNTDLPISEIAFLLGYNDPSNFGNAFKRWAGHSPSDYRK
ncbi:MAG: AraC family transcriptional regulator [Proteobacteria bacterium]|nr:AraC family transcriptional regulator [Pseudomonadota bacterium]